MRSLVGLRIGVDLALLVGAAPADEGHRVGHIVLRLYAGRCQCGCQHIKIASFNFMLFSLLGYPFWFPPRIGRLWGYGS
jgi:hypothetical protein